MPKPLFSKLIVQAAIGFFCVLFGCAFSFQMEDMLFLSMSLAIGICCILRCVLLYRLIHRKNYRILTGICTAREMSLLKRTQQIRLSDPNGREYAVCCKIKLPKVAKQNWRKLHLHFGESCKVSYIGSQERAAPIGSSQV